MFENIKIGWYTLFDKWSLGHLFASVLVSFLFGFVPSFLFGAYYDASQSYMPRTMDRPIWSWIEQNLFTSNQITDMYDVFIYNLVGSLIGSFIRYYFIGATFFGLLNV